MKFNRGSIAGVDPFGNPTQLGGTTLVRNFRATATASTQPKYKLNTNFLVPITSSGVRSSGSRSIDTSVTPGGGRISSGGSSSSSSGSRNITTNVPHPDTRVPISQTTTPTSSGSGVTAEATPLLDSGTPASSSTGSSASYSTGSGSSGSSSVSAGGSATAVPDDVVPPPKVVEVQEWRHHLVGNAIFIPLPFPVMSISGYFMKLKGA